MRTSVLATLALALVVLNIQGASVLLQHNTAGSTGVNPSETTLTPSNVNKASFGKKFSVAVDGVVQAQPLYDPSVTVRTGAHAGTHDLAFVVTHHDSLYAIDVNTGAVVWKTSFLDSGLPGATSITTVPAADVKSSDITPEIGICATPVIDSGTGLLYVTAKTKQTVSGHNHYVYTLNKIDITDGNATPDDNIVSSTVIGDTICDDPTDSPGNFTYRTADDPSAGQDPFTANATGDGAISVNGQSRVYFNALRELNRPGLIVINGIVYIAFGSHGDNGPYHGWVLGYNASTLALVAALNVTPNGGLGGIWSCGTAPAADGSGHLFLMTGNGSFDGSISNGSVVGLTNGLPSNGNYGDCFIKVVPSATTVSNQGVNGYGLAIADYFSPTDNQSLSDADRDLGSGGCTVLPDSAGSGSHPHLLVGAGKEGVVYLIDRDNMGGFGTSDNVVQEHTYIGSFDTPAFFNGVLYYGMIQNTGSGLTITNASLPNGIDETPDTFSWPGATPSISANGTSNGIVWMTERTSIELRAYSAADLSNELWTSAQASGSRDSLGSYTKFSVPTVADGHVMVGTANALVIYGELGSNPVTPAVGAPVVATGAASAMTGTGVTLSASVNPESASTQVVFQYGTTSASLGSTSGQVSAGAGSTATPVTGNVSGLNPSTTYYYRAVATNSAGSTNGAIKSFRTLAQQSVGSSPASYLAATGAEISYTVDPGGLATTSYIHYGTDSNYGNQTATVNVGKGGVSVTLLAQLSGLAAGTTYHYQIVTQSASGTITSSDQVFTTLPFDTTLVAKKGDAPEALPGTTYASFGVPIINDSGNVAFRAVLASGGGVTPANNVAIFADDGGGTQQLIARTGVTVAPGVSPSVFTALHDPVYNASEEVAFIGTASIAPGGATKTSDTGVWWTNGGSLQLLAREGTQAPGLAAGANFASFLQVALPDVNGPIFEATLGLNAAAGINAGNSIGIWATGGNGVVSKVVRTGDMINGKKITALSFMAASAPVLGATRAFDPFSSDITFLATFSDKTTAVVTSDLIGSYDVVALSGTSAPGAGGANFASFGTPAIAIDDHTAFRAVLNGAGVTAANNVGIFGGNNQSPDLVARIGSAAPGTTSTYATLSDPVTDANSHLAFVGTLRIGAGLAAKGSATGIWTTQNYQLGLAVLSGTQAPGCPTGATFASFAQIALPYQYGVAFLGHLNVNAAAHVSAPNSLGIWASDTAGNLQLIARTGDVLDGKTVTGLTFLSPVPSVLGQSRSVSGSANITYLATFSDQSTAVYSVVFP